MQTPRFNIPHPGQTALASPRHRGCRPSPHDYARPTDAGNARICRRPGGGMAAVVGQADAGCWELCAACSQWRTPRPAPAHRWPAGTAATRGAGRIGQVAGDDYAEAPLSPALVIEPANLTAQSLRRARMRRNASHAGCTERHAALAADQPACMHTVIGNPRHGEPTQSRTSSIAAFGADRVLRNGGAGALSEHDVIQRVKPCPIRASRAAGWPVAAGSGCLPGPLQGLLP